MTVTVLCFNITQIQYSSDNLIKLIFGKLVNDISLST